MTAARRSPTSNTAWPPSCPGAPVDADGIFGPATRAAVEAFQRLRGLRVDGVCGPQTWNTLVEAGFRLGDRFLYRRTPMLRGDDVADLQQRLCTLGFDTGRVDGIFGDATVRALGEFQRNAGLPVDGIVGRRHAARAAAPREPPPTSPSWSRPSASGPPCATPRRPCAAATSRSARAAGSAA